MTPLRRTAAIAASLLLALALASCGVDAGDAAAGTGSGGQTATTAPDLTPQQEQMVDTISKTYQDLGFTEKEADCLAKGMAGAMGDPNDPAAMGDVMDVINQCDIPVSRFSEIQGNMGVGNTEDAMKKSMMTGLENIGMTEKEADCVAGKFLDTYGADLESMQDPAKLQPLLEDCGVDPSGLHLGG